MIEPDLAPDLRARRRTAFHEAGHAVVGWALGLEVGWVRIIDDSNGKADVAIPDDLSLVDQIAVAMGGEYGAECSGVEVIHDVETLGDEIRVFNLTQRAFPEDEAFGDTLRRAGRNRAEKLIAGHVDMVGKVADELLCRSEILEGEFARLFPQLSSKEPA
ncbi:hypothetical protein BB934_09535 [Microvirga ossetica]|uniref:Peptidase M41 domain-containing protein n=1 Tax=Microvirga ossetica TaxID=1882682 RepID=A0A1B2EEN8_9HYPH|nr:hypothetical protein [Microvirga ossetica]ANY78440.1 hypothetical protein BB934_09535 [Microvirga ossetica]